MSAARARRRSLATRRFGDWSRERLVAMDRRFRERVERALKMGDENRQAAAATYDANPARGALEVA